MKYYINDEIIEFVTILENKEKASVFNHFKNKLYKIYTIAKDSETLEDIVVYQQQYGSLGYFTRPAKMFFSDVDSEKYPLVAQKKRFMKLP